MPTLKYWDSGLGQWRVLSGPPGKDAQPVLQTGFDRRGSTAVVCTSGAVTLIPVDQLVTSNGNAFGNTGNNTFTVPEDGTYAVTAAVGTAGATFPAGSFITIGRNGLAIARSFATRQHTWESVCCTVQVRCVIGDKISFGFYHEQGSNFTLRQLSSVTNMVDGYLPWLSVWKEGGPKGADGSAVPANVSPTGSLLAYAGQVAPEGWLLCDGSAVPRTTYSALFSIIGTVYGPGDGNFTFNLPDLRGRSVVGAGQGSGLTSRVLGATGGEEAHSLTWLETGAHFHNIGVSVTVNNTDVNHWHTLGGHTHSQANHQHGIPAAVAPGATATFQYVEAGTDPGTGRGSQLTNADGGGGTTSGPTTNTLTSWQSDGSANHIHGHTNSASGSCDTQGSGHAHNTMQPFAVLNYLIKT